MYLCIAAVLFFDHSNVTQYIIVVEQKRYFKFAVTRAVQPLPHLESRTLDVNESTNGILLYFYTRLP